MSPTMIIWGQDDKCLPVEFAERFRQDIKGSTVNIIPDCGHNPQEETAILIMEYLMEFQKVVSFN